MSQLFVIYTQFRLSLGAQFLASIYFFFFRYFFPRFLLTFWSFFVPLYIVCFSFFCLSSFLFYYLPLFRILLSFLSCLAYILFPSFRPSSLYSFFRTFIFLSFYIFLPRFFFFFLPIFFFSLLILFPPWYSPHFPSLLTSQPHTISSLATSYLSHISSS